MGPDMLLIPQGMLYLHLQPITDSNHLELNRINSKVLLGPNSLLLILASNSHCYVWNLDLTPKAMLRPQYLAVSHLLFVELHIMYFFREFLHKSFRPLFI